MFPGSVVREPFLLGRNTFIVRSKRVIVPTGLLCSVINNASVLKIADLSVTSSGTFNALVTTIKWLSTFQWCPKKGF